MAEAERRLAREEIGLHNLSPKPGSRKPRKRLGRGEGSGLGKTSGRGHKGAGSRSGAKRKAGYEGGQNPIHMRMRKLRGPHMKKSMPFENFRTSTQPVNVGDLEERFDAGAEVDPGVAQGEGPGDPEGSRSRSSPAARSRRSSRSTRTPSARPPGRRSRRPAVPVTLWSRNAQDYCERFQRRGHPQEARVHGGDAAALPAGRLHPRAGGRRPRGQGTAEQLRRQQHPRLPQPLLGRRPLAALAVRAGDHALHHRLDHPAAADGGRALAGETAERGRGRPAEDHPVHALPDRRPGLRAVLRLRPPLPLLRRPGRRRQPPRQPQRRQSPADRDLPDRRLHAADVAGRADHPARHRQRHLADDLRLDRLPHPERARRPGGPTPTRSSS